MSDVDKASQGHDELQQQQNGQLNSDEVSGNSTLQNGNFCVESCGRVNDNKTVSCLLCAKDYHRVCVNIKSTAANPAFTCQDCRSMFVVIKTIANDITVLNGNINVQTKLLEKKLHDIETMNTKLSQENASLKEQVTSLTTLIQTSQWHSFRNNGNKKELLLSDSTLATIDESKLLDTDIISISGAKIDTLAEEVEKLSNAKYERITIMVGSNDINDSKENEDSQDLIPKFTNLLDKAKNKSNCVTVSSVCPRLDNAENQTKIDTLNQHIEVMCTDNDCNFANHKQIFTLEDGSINDGYLVGGKGPLLTKSGVNKLARNLKLRIKQDVKDITKPQPSNSNKNYRGKPHMTGKRRDATPNNQTRHRDRVTPMYRREENRNYQNEEVTYSSQACYYCNEEGHSMQRCRHKGPVKCHLCGKEGHKQKHHNNEFESYYNHKSYYDYDH